MLGSLDFHHREPCPLLEAGSPLSRLVPGRGSPLDWQMAPSAVSSRGLFTVRGCEAERALRCLFPLRVKHFRSKDSVSLPKQQPCVPCRVQLFATPWTAALEAPLSMEFSRQEHWSGLPLPSPGIFLTQRSNLPLLCLLHRQAGSLSAEPLGKPQRGPTLNSLLNTFKDFGMMIQIRGVGVCVCTNIRQKHIRFEKGYWQRSGPTFCFSICDFFFLPSFIQQIFI